jgi:hypothetical protein
MNWNHPATARVAARNSDQLRPAVFVRLFMIRISSMTKQAPPKFHYDLIEIGAAGWA